MKIEFDDDIQFNLNKDVAADTCTFILNGNITSFQIETCRMIIAYYSFVEYCDNMRLPLNINLHSLRYQDAKITANGHGSMLVDYLKIDDIKYRRQLARKQLFRHDVCAFVGEHVRDVNQNAGEEHLPSFRGVVHPCVHSVNTTPLKAFSDKL